MFAAEGLINTAIEQKYAIKICLRVKELPAEITALLRDVAVDIRSTSDVIQNVLKRSTT